MHVHFKFQTVLSFTQCIVQKVKVQLNSNLFYDGATLILLEGGGLLTPPPNKNF